MESFTNRIVVCPMTTVPQYFINPSAAKVPLPGKPTHILSIQDDVEFENAFGSINLGL